MSGDPRNTLVLDGLADARLQGVVAAQSYRATTPMQVSASVAPVRAAPAPDAEQLDQVLFGETVEVLAERDGFAFGQAARDGYVGWVDLEALSQPPLAPTHRVTALRTYGFSEPSIKSAPVGLISLNALVTAQGEADRFLRCARFGFVPSVHLAPVGEAFETDPAEAALRFLGAPYLWGGRESLGLDCSGLVQQAMLACGRAAPRDSDQQQGIGTPLPPGAPLKRGDLVFWRGHVGIMLDPETLLHANAFHMAVAREPLAEARARIAAAGGGEITARRRP